MYDLQSRETARGSPRYHKMKIIQKKYYIMREDIKNGWKLSKCHETDSFWYGSVSSCKTSTQESFEAKALSYSEKTPLHKKGKQICLKMLSRQFILFLSGKLAYPTSPPWKIPLILFKTEPPSLHSFIDFYSFWTY